MSDKLEEQKGQKTWLQSYKDTFELLIGVINVILGLLALLSYLVGFGVIVNTVLATLFFGFLFLLIMGRLHFPTAGTTLKEEIKKAEKEEKKKTAFKGKETFPQLKGIEKDGLPIDTPNANIVLLESSAFSPFLQLYKGRFKTLSPMKELSRKNALWGIIAHFENVPNPPQRIESLGRVRAKISYSLFGSPRSEFARINTGCWVGKDVFNPMFDVNTPHHLVLGTFPSNDSTEPLFSFYEYSEKLQKPVKSLHKFSKPFKIIVKVSLIPEQYNELTHDFTFELTIEGGEDNFFVNLNPQ